MKTLNDTLREEFEEILKSKHIKEQIITNELDENLIREAFEILLTRKDNTDIDKSKTEFENFVINQIKSNDH